MEKATVRSLVGSLLVWCSVSVQANAGWTSVQKSLRLYDTLAPDEIVWGQESASAKVRAVIEPRLLTAYPGQVEVIEFVRYPQNVWRKAEALSRAWRASLPDGVVVRRVPLELKAGSFGQRVSPGLLLDQQRVYFAAEVFGMEEAAHAALIRAGERGDKSVRRAVAEIVGSTAVDAAEFDAVRDHEVMRSQRQATRVLWWRRNAALDAAGYEAGVPWLFPELVIDGKYAVSASRIGDPRAAYHLANRLIREELEAGGAQSGPTNNEEFGAWMASRAGEVLKPVYADHVARRFGVYAPARKEMWLLSEAGKVYGSYRLYGAGRESYFRYATGSRVHYLDMWRLARQYQSFPSPDGTAQKYGAWLLMEHLCAADTHWVRLRFKGRKGAFAFSCDGTVEALTNQGSRFGSWWLEAGDLKVEVGEVGFDSWPWMDVAKAAGWEIPQRSLTPWRFEPEYGSEQAQARTQSTGGDR